MAWLGIAALALVLALAGLVLATRPPSQAALGSSLAAATPALTSDLLGVGVPQAAPDQALQLIRYTLAPGATTAAHPRPGIRVSYVAAGAYEFTLLSGQAEVWRAGVSRTSGQPTTLKVGVAYVFRPGDALFLDEGVVSKARSLGPGPLVLWQAALSSTNQLTVHAPIAVGTPPA